MAVKYSVNYISAAALAHGDANHPRTLEKVIDFTLAANQTAGATDSLSIFEVPVGSLILAAGIEQITAGSAGNTYKARIGTVDLSGTLASDATAATVTANADVSGGAPYTVVTAADFNLLSATGIRATGVARAWIVVTNANDPYPVSKLAARDQTTGLA